MTKTTNEPTLNPQWICMTCKTVIGPIVDDNENRCKCNDEYEIELWRVSPTEQPSRLSRLSTLEAAVEERDGIIKNLREFISNNQYISEFDLTSSFNGDTCDCFACKAEKILNETAPKVQS